MPVRDSSPEEQAEETARFRQHLERLVGDVCSGYADMLFPETVTLLFGDEKPTLEDHQMLFLSCLWQLTRAGKSICAYAGARNHDGQMETHLNKLKSQRLAEARLTAPDLRLYLVFESGLKLSIFPRKYERVSNEGSYLFGFTEQSEPWMDGDKQMAAFSSMSYYIAETLQLFSNQKVAISRYRPHMKTVKIND